MRHLLLAIGFISLAVATIAFINNRSLRNEIRAALGPEFNTPEERIIRGYDRPYLQLIADRLLHTKPAGLDGTLLDRYSRPGLLWNDVTFAISLGIFSTSLWMWVLMQFGPSGALRYLLVVMTISSLLYAIFDTAEDLALVHAFRTPAAISDGEAQIASILTRLKFVSIVGSVAGAVVFQTLQVIVPDDAKPLFRK
ncbi:hypothetical protein [Bradyrhizobium sp.]|uniref:hypothetical protein n=1 Tax=Bradyrhizobium sp. TaxID=376 RepID=UPI001DA64CC8|nr:hypothetical protein [Bradyrhizobium sp.]MBI5321802.1 hypothetical protein [Bradyrhizobium sp.]